MLHGDIKVNHRVIGWWQAVNKGDAYHVKAEYETKAGYPMVADFMLDRDGTEGVLLLTARIITEVHHQMTPKPMADEEITELYVSHLLGG